MLHFYSSVLINRCKQVDLQKKKNGNKHEQRKHNTAKVNCSSILHAPQFKVYMISRHAKQANSLLHQIPNELFGIYFFLFLRSRFSTFVLLFDNRCFPSSFICIVQKPPLQIPLSSFGLKSDRVSAGFSFSFGKGFYSYIHQALAIQPMQSTCTLCISYMISDNYLICLNLIYVAALSKSSHTHTTGIETNKKKQPDNTCFSFMHHST